MKSVLIVFSMMFAVNPNSGFGVWSATSTSELTHVHSYTKSYHEAGVSEKAFNLAIDKLKEVAKNEQYSALLTIIDFNLPSTAKRFWVLDLDSKEVLFNTYVSHGRNSGENNAIKFSNKPESHMSSLGLYLTGDVYYGKHGLSLYLDGLEPGVNDNARKRSIVIHGADYVSHDFIKKHGRLGRSYGCPALPLEHYKEIIGLIANGSFIYINKQTI
ncbi:murein L,D-transpeptidase catalytic domain family protein [Fulvivirga sp.]|uniref:murein L,D-transpeptidase catalytic domain family protein n=1 Tax=Fulvivirga sp. TaxID=1931237 RepID=UPI0032ED27C5